MDLRNLTEEEALMLEHEEAKASINIGRRPHPSAFPGYVPSDVVEVGAVTRLESLQRTSPTRAGRKAS
jgi:hypothetical protein